MALATARAATPRTVDLLRLATAGSVDDGKSTLIGRLLYDAKQVLEDQLAHIEEVSERRGDAQVNLALLTDGLRAEREQGITIDVAYRYFATARRRFVLADTPGHAEYTRNMVTGASTADLAIVLLDARHGIVEQSKRHAYIAALLGIPHVVLAVNKMDTVDFAEARFSELAREFEAFAKRLGVPDVTCFPISALHGDNVVERSARTPWYDGPALLEHLETVEIASSHNYEDARFPVQWVIRPRTGAVDERRRYAGQVAGGAWRVGDEVVVLPSGRRSRIAAIEAPGGPVDVAVPPLSVTIQLADELDVARGDLLAHPDAAPSAVHELEATVCWLGERPLRAGAGYAIKHTTRTARAVVEAVGERIDVHTLEPQPGTTELELNDIGHVRLRTSAPLMVDAYRRNRMTGSFILIDEATNDTVGAGMVVGEAARPARRRRFAAWPLLV